MHLLAHALLWTAPARRVRSGLLGRAGGRSRCAAGERPETPVAPKLFTQGYGAAPRSAPTLYVVLHGNGRRSKIDTSDFAKALAAVEPGSAVVHPGLRRPHRD